MAEVRSSVAVAIATPARVARVGLVGLVGLAAAGLFVAPSGPGLAVSGLGLLGAGLLAVFLYRGRRAAGRGDALARALAPLCLYLAATTAVVTASATDRAWDTARLLPSIAWVKGHDVYATQSSGSVQTTMYPPFWVVSYAPAALAATPVGALRIGIVLTLLFSLAPLAFVLARAGPGPGLALLGFASFVFASRLIASLDYSVFQLHADAPAFGLALAACVLLLRDVDRAGRWQLPAAALLAWLSVWTKQVMLPILLALPLWIAVVRGLRPALRLVAWEVGSGIVVAGVLLALFPLEGVWFGAVTIPARAPWRLDGTLPRALQLLDASVELSRHALPLLLFLSLGVGAQWWLRAAGGSAPSLRGWLRESPWSLALLVGLAMAPVSALGRVKVGGDANTMSPTTGFLLVACILACIAVPKLLEGPGAARLRQAVVAFLACVTLALGAVATAESYRRALVAGHVSQHPTQLAYEHLRSRDPQAFFPTHPLAHLFADGSFPHLAMALHDREYLSSLPLSAGHRSAFLPESPSMVCWDWSWGVSWVARNYFSAYLQETHPPDLGDRWECYVRGPAAGSARLP